MYTNEHCTELGVTRHAILHCVPYSL